MTRRNFRQPRGTSLPALLSRAASRRSRLNPDSLAKFVDPLPIPEIAKPSGSARSRCHIRRRSRTSAIPMRQVECKLHRDLPPTRLWCYGRTSPGPTFETRSGQGLLIEWPNELPTQAFSADRPQPARRGSGQARSARRRPYSRREDAAGERRISRRLVRAGKSRTYFYPNRQEAAALWYHDHAMGINRLNIYAGHVRAVPDSRRFRRRAESAEGRVRDSARDLRSAC